MKLSTVFRPFTDTQVIEGRITDPQRDEWAGQVRKARLEVARGRNNWEEIPETRLVRRGRFLVDGETDLTYTLRRGVVFEPGRASIGYVTDQMPMTYFVTERGEIQFLEPGPCTWTEMVERKARRAT
jgi:hypothetical protein